VTLFPDCLAGLSHTAAAASLYCQAADNIFVRSCGIVIAVAAGGPAVVMVCGGEVAKGTSPQHAACAVYAASLRVVQGSAG
jgi:hypothetical protein